MSNFKKVIEARRKAAKNAPPPQKAISEMSEAELDAEEQRARAELRQAREREIAATREAVEETSRRPKFLAFKRQRRPWK